MSDKKRFKLSLRFLRKVFLGLSFAVLFFGLGYKTSAWKSKKKITSIKQFIENPSEHAVEGADFANFWEVWRRLERSYVEPDKIDYEEMTYGSIEGLAQSLGDPYTQYLPPTRNKQSKENLNGKFYGVGIELGYKSGNLAVISPLEGSPAKREGVRAGDLIMHIKDDAKGIDEDARKMNLREAVTKIRGEKGKPITLTLFREGEAEPFEAEIHREEILIPSLEVEYIKRSERKLAHFKLYRFGGRTNTEWLQKVGEALANHVDGVILDLRNNPGGYLDGAVFVVSEFLDEGVVVKQEGRRTSKSLEVNRKGNLLNIPLVVLVNQGSASSSEITAGALQDHERAVIVGEQTFGKGTVQEVQELSDGSALHVTIAKWILPEGRWIGDGGITPDVEVKDNFETEDVDEQLERAVEELIGKN